MHVHVNRHTDNLISRYAVDELGEDLTRATLQVLPLLAYGRSFLVMGDLVPEDAAHVEIAYQNSSLE